MTTLFVVLVHTKCYYMHRGVQCDGGQIPEHPQITLVLFRNLSKSNDTRRLVKWPLVIVETHGAPPPTPSEPCPRVEVRDNIVRGNRGRLPAPPGLHHPHQ